MHAVSKENLQIRVSPNKKRKRGHHPTAKVSLPSHSATLRGIIRDLSWFISSRPYSLLPSNNFLYSEFLLNHRQTLCCAPCVVRWGNQGVWSSISIAEMKGNGGSSSRLLQNLLPCSPLFKIDTVFTHPFNPVALEPISNIPFSKNRHDTQP